VLFGFPRAARLDWGARCGSLSTWCPARSFSPSLCRLSGAVPVKPPERGQAGRGRTSPQARAAVQPAPPPCPKESVLRADAPCGPGPFRPLNRARHRATADCEVVPVAGWTVPTCRPAKSASGPHAGYRLPPMPAARYGKARRAFLPLGSKRSRSIRQRKPGNHDMRFGRCGRNGVGFSARGWKCWMWGGSLCTGSRCRAPSSVSCADTFSHGGEKGGG
jgi:hypothetical protein